MLASIIITNFNYGKYISRCLRSCLAQSLSRDEYEIIVIDDCSNDDSDNIIKSFLNEKNFIYIRNKKNIGVAAAANIGIRKSKGKFVVRVDSDDWVSVEFLKFLVFYLEDHKSAFCVSCDYKYVDNSEKIIERITYQDNPISCGVMYRKDLLIKLGMYNEDFKHREEEELRARLGSLYKIHNLNIALYRYRKHQTNKTKQEDMMTLFKQRLDDEYSARKKNLKNYKGNKKLFNYIVAVIPARYGSKRLKNKNILNVWGKPMIHWTIKAAKESKYIDDIYVSSESKKILDLVKEMNVKTIKRPDFLAKDDVYKMDTIVHAVNNIKENKKPDLIISLQANSPQIKANDIDKAIEHLVKYSRSEVISVDEYLNQNGAIRVMRYPTVYEKTLSTYIGFVVTDILDIHTKKDLNLINKKNPLQ